MQTPRPSVARRQMEIWVEIPPSPLHTMSRGPSTISKVTTPFTPRRIDHNVLRKDHVANNVKMNPEHAEPTSLFSSSRKRKLAEPEESMASVAKKPKVTKADDGGEAFPNGFFHCHQCTRKQDISHALGCTRSTKGKRCRAKYCTACLHNRYEKDADAIRSSGLPHVDKESEGHFQGDGYIFSCPRCLDICNCRRCRKAKGLAPLGRLAPMPTKTEVQPKKAKEFKKPATAKRSLSKSATVVVEIIRQSPSKASTSTATANARVPTKPPAATKAAKPHVPRPVKPVPQPTWTAIPTDLTLTEVEERIQLREFMMRFAPIMTNVSNKTLECLEEFESLPDPACKAVLLALLDLIAVDKQGSARKDIAHAVEDIRASGLNFDTMWAALADLREATHLDFPDPAPTARTSNTHQRTTRSGGGRHFTGEQFLPILLALVDQAIQGPSIREELEIGEQDRKRENEAMFAARRQENARWEDEKAKLMEEKAKGEGKNGWKVGTWKEKYQERYQAHKITVTNLEQGHAKDVHLRSPRFNALGTDTDGRVYYALSPSTTKRLPSETDRQELRRWSWVVAVWGSPPQGAEINHVADQMDTSSDDDEEDGESGDKDGNRWWGFAEPQDITQLAKWLDAGSGSASRSSSSDGSNASSSTDGRGGLGMSAAGLKPLVKGLNEFAELLRWRLSRRDPPKNASIPASRFYA